MTTIESRDHLAQETAEYIAANLSKPTGAIGQEGRPTDVEEIKTALLDGRVWISWLNDRVTAAMRKLHGEPTGDVTALLPDAREPYVADPWTPNSCACTGTCTRHLEQCAVCLRRLPHDYVHWTGDRYQCRYCTTTECRSCGYPALHCSWSQNPTAGRGDCCPACQHS